MTTKGLYCPAGDFYIDPKGAVDHAIITHAHSDHARRGSKHYYCATSGISLLKTRLGSNITITSFPYGKPFFLKNVELSLHPAGHILGSAQVRIKFANEVWVVSGDYKRETDPTCEPFESLQCDVFISEATFGTPAFVWNKNADLGKEIFDWWQENRERKINSILFAYSLGKAQRILALLAPFAKEPIYCDAATMKLNDCYRQQNINLAATINLEKLDHDEILSGKFCIVPPSFLQSPKAKILGKHFNTAFASGWMARQSQQFDKGFLISDHADWTDLLKTILETGAKRVYIQHRGNGALVKHLNSLGIKAFADEKLFPKNPAQLAFL